MFNNFYNNYYCWITSLSKYVTPLEDYSGYWKNKRKDFLVLFNCDYLDFYIDKVPQIMLFGIDKILDRKNYPDHRIRRIRTVTSSISSIDEKFLALHGKHYHSFRNAINRYQNKIIVQDHFNKLEDVITMIDDWGWNLGLKYRRTQHIGYDKRFFIEFYEKEKNNLYSLFFYDKDLLIGFSIIVHVKDNIYNYILGKSLADKYPQVSQFIDWYSFKNIYDRVQQDFYVDWGGSDGGLLLYKRKFNLCEEYKVYFFKIERIDNDK